MITETAEGWRQQPTDLAGAPLRSSAIAERRVRPLPENPRVALVMVTDGRFHLFMQAFRSALTDVLSPAFEQIIVVNDSADPDYARQLDFDVGSHVEGATMIHHEARRGFTGAINSGWSAVDSARVDYVLHMEDDFVLNEPLDLRKWIYPLTLEPLLAQVVLLRQPWNHEEITAGGVMQLTPESFTEHSWGGVNWTEHRRGYWSNPHVAPSWVTDLRWPDSEGEPGFSKLLYDATGNDGIPVGLRSSYLGGIADPPRVHHIGDDRTPDWFD